MSSSNLSNYYMGSFIGSLVGGIMILVADFAGWDDSNYYLGVYSEGWIGTDSGGGALLILGTIGLAMLYVAYQSFMGTREPLTPQTLELTYKISLGSLIAVLVGGLIFVIAIIGEDVYWWFDAGFYGSAIGGLISTLTLRSAKNA